MRKINDVQKLPFVWRWLVDAEINCQSLRHQIEKMRMQHDEELQVNKLFKKCYKFRFESNQFVVVDFFDNLENFTSRQKSVYYFHI